MISKRRFSHREGREGNNATIWTAFDKRWQRDVVVKVPKHLNPIVRKEWKILTNLSHTNIIAPLGTCRTDSGVAMILPFASDGDLATIVPNIQSHNEMFVKSIVHQIAKAINYLHNEKNRIHRDVKLDNILIHNRTPLLADFENCTLSNGVDYTDDDVGTFQYFPPEFVNFRIYGKPGDVWALGITTIVLYAREWPFRGETDDMIIEEIRKGLLEDVRERLLVGISDDGKSAITAMLKLSDKERITIADLLTHPWLTSKPTSSSATAML
jgi:serine/threonine protein kinase